MQQYLQAEAQVQHIQGDDQRRPVVLEAGVVRVKVYADNRDEDQEYLSDYTFIFIMCHVTTEHHHGNDHHYHMCIQSSEVKLIEILFEHSAIELFELFRNYKRARISQFKM